MFFKTSSRINPQTGQMSIYYRLVETSRNILGDVYQRTIISVGFMDDVSTAELHRIADGLNERIDGQLPLLEDSEKVRGYINRLYDRLVKEKRIDRLLDTGRRMQMATGIR